VRRQIRGFLLETVRRMRRAISEFEEKRFKRRRTMNKSRWQWLSGASLGTAIGVGLFAIGLSPWLLAAAGVAGALAINKLELE
jgi:hypothetical protein